MSHSQQYGDPLLILCLNSQLEGTAQTFVFIEVSKAIFTLLAQHSLIITREGNTTSTCVATKQGISGKEHITSQPFYSISGRETEGKVVGL